MKFALFCLAAGLFTIACSAQSLQGNWQASVEEHGEPIRYVLHIFENGSRVSATLDDPGRFAFDNPVDPISVTNSTLQFSAGLVSYQGVLSSTSDEIVGTWSLEAEPQKVTWHRFTSAPDRVETVAKGLMSLMYLPAEKWRIHAGDVAHGEAIDLDDSSWEQVGAGSVAPYDAVWYRRLVEIPKTLNGYDLTGSKIWFDFQYDANGPVTEIVYFNGRRVAMGDDLEPIVLFGQVHPGEKVLVAVKLLRSVDQKHFNGVRLRIDFPDARPDPGKLLDVMGAVSILAATPQNQQVRADLEATAQAVDYGALDRGDQAAFDASLTRAEALLAPLKPALQRTSLEMTGNSHIDAAWLWPWTETVEVVRRTFGTALQLMEEYPQYTYTQSAAAYSEWMEEKYPALHEQIVNRVKQGRWEMVGGMWVEPDLNMPDGESLVRQLLIGKRYFKEKFGTDVRIGWNPDSFGYNWQLPQIYKRSGIDYFVTQKMAWNDTNQLPMKIFWWQSPDGSRVLTYFPHDYGNEIEPLSMARDIATTQALNPGVPEMMHLFGVGDHGGGPTRAMLDQGVRWSEPDVIYPKAHFGLAQAFFSNIENKADTEHAPLWNYKVLASGKAQLPAPPAGEFSLPVWNDELYFEYHRGVFTTQAQHKRSMRESEEQVLNAEKLSSLAWLAGDGYPGAELTKAWKKVLFNQFHDLAAGSGVGDIYRDAQQDYEYVRLETGQVSSEALHTIESMVDTRAHGATVPVLVMNPLAWQRTDLVSVDLEMPESSKVPLSVTNSEGEPQVFQVLSTDPARNTYKLLVEARTVPSLGYRVLYVTRGGSSAPTDLQVHGLTLENASLRVGVDPKTGCIASIYDKRSNFESIAPNGCGNELIAFKDTPKNYDAWNIDSDFEQQSTKLDMADSVEVVERGPLRATVRVMRHWQNSKFVQDISVYAGLDRVDVHNDFDWHENHILLKAAFPLAASSSQATYEIPYGTIERPTTRNNRFEQAKFEVPALRWADLGDGVRGFSLINESKYGYDGKENVLRLSLLRSPTWPDPDADRGHHSFSYSLYPHSGDWKQALTVRRGYEFNYKLMAVQVQAHSGTLAPSHSFVMAKENHVVLTAVKKAEDADGLILRFYEWAGKSGEVHLTVPNGAIGAQVTDLMEHPQGPALSLANADEITVPVTPYQIVSLRVDYPRRHIDK
jgi:alpha-mannosidase